MGRWERERGVQGEKTFFRPRFEWNFWKEDGSVTYVEITEHNGLRQILDENEEMREILKASKPLQMLSMSTVSGRGLLAKIEDTP